MVLNLAVAVDWSDAGVARVNLAILNAMYQLVVIVRRSIKG